MIKRKLSEQARVYTILVVEDEVMLRFVTSEFLREAGFVVVEAANADEALPYIRAHPEIDLVFSDVRMPGQLDGLKLVQQLSREYPQLPCMLASGHFLPEPDLQVPFFRKPYDLGKVVTEIAARLRTGSSQPGANDL
jgi:CheY-like chemotaxis protein